MVRVKKGNEKMLELIICFPFPLLLESFQSTQTQTLHEIFLFPLNWTPPDGVVFLFGELSVKQRDCQIFHLPILVVEVRVWSVIKQSLIG